MRFNGGSSVTQRCREPKTSFAGEVYQRIVTRDRRNDERERLKEEGSSVSDDSPLKNLDCSTIKYPGRSERFVSSILIFTGARINTLRRRYQNHGPTEQLSC